MDSRRTTRLLVAAFALSVLIHLIVASGVRWPFIRTRDETETVRIQHVRIARIAHVPTPPPHTPPPTPPPTATPAPVRSSAPAPKRVAHLSSKGMLPAGAGKAGTHPSVPATVAPKPLSTPTPSCVNNDLPAAIAQSPPPAEIAPQARADGVTGTTRVRVSLDASGNVQSTTVTNSSGSSSLDLVAVSMARNAVYTPAQHNCRAVASDYVYSVRFIAW